MMNYLLWVISLVYMVVTVAIIWENRKNPTEVEIRFAKFHDGYVYRVKEKNDE